MELYHGSGHFRKTRKSSCSLIALEKYLSYTKIVTDVIDTAEADIKSLKVQGATNVALKVLDTLSEVMHNNPDTSCYELTKIGERLAYARPTEPLAQNAVRYVSLGCTSEALNRIEEYREYVAAGKKTIPALGAPLLADGGVYLTLCHSSTTVNMFTNARSKGAYFSVYVAETRPRFQGRTTAKELLAAGFSDVTMVVDDVAVSLIEGRIGKIDAVFIGADLVNDKGFVNKIGSLAVSAAAKRKHIPVYVLTTLLKYDPKPFSPALIETRSTDEIWAEAPANLKFYAPAFDYVPYLSNIKVICEDGVIAGKQVLAATKKRYPFIFDKGHDKHLYYGKSV